MPSLPIPITNSIEKLQQLQSLGRRSAQRVTLDLLQSEGEVYDEIINALKDMRSQIDFCSNCYFFAQKLNPNGSNLCEICADSKRDKYKICVVEKPTDVLNLERTQIYNGLYQVINNLISPIDNIFVEDTYLGDLVDRRLVKLTQDKNQKVEVILFFKAGFGAEATTAYLRDRIKNLGLQNSISLTKLAEGLPLYYNPESLDQATIIRALEDRKAV